MKRIVLIGATGSVGRSVVDICRRFPEQFSLRTLVGASRLDALAACARETGARTICATEPDASVAAQETEDLRAFRQSGGEVRFGYDFLEEIVTSDTVDHVVFASSGTSAIRALQKALVAGKEVSVANKESLVVAGPWVMPLVSRPHQLRPVDSEHSAIWQCLQGESAKCVSKIVLTASGGPFREYSRSRMEGVTPAEALAHPVWKMGPKVTVDSATLMNKGIECIEAMRLFDLECDRVDAVIHPKSLVHGMVHFADGAVKLLLSNPDMRLPAAVALAWPERLDLLGETDATGKKFAPPEPEAWALEFAPIDAERFPCFALALEAGRRGGAYPSLLIGADEVAVEAFLAGKLPFMRISTVIESVLAAYNEGVPTSLEEAVGLIDRGRRMASDICEKREV